MQQPEYRNNIQSMEGIGEETAFDVEINETIFQMLSSDVYNDPPLAVMREWSTNACDACLAAGLPVLYDVHLPTLENPTFFVRDYGTGLAPSDVKGLFSKLGHSTKRGSDALNGCLGIGRMAGLAVSDAFTVESFYEGTHYSFVVSMKKGRPVIVALSETPTDEPNGLKLSVNVAMDDLDSFASRALNLYKFFDYKPNLNLDIDVSYDTGEEDWFIANELPHGNYVLMSQVLYKIPNVSEISDYGFNSIVMKAPPGAVTFNPGRESLSLNQGTVSYVNSMFERTAKAFIEKAKQDFSKCSTDFEVMKVYRSTISASPLRLRDKIDPMPYLSDYAQALALIDYSGTKNPNLLKVSRDFKTLCSGTISLSHKNSYYKNAKSMVTDSVGENSFYNTTHLLVDRKTNFRSQLNKEFYRTSYVTWCKSQGTDIEEFLEKAKDVLKVMGIPYKLLSEVVPEDAQEKSGNTPRERFHALKVHNTAVLRSEKMEEGEVADTDWLYLKLSGSKPIISDDTHSFSDYQTMYTLLKKVTTMPEVRGVPKKYQQYVDTRDNWIDYETSIKEKIKEFTFVSPMEGEFKYLSRYTDKTARFLFPKPIQEAFEEFIAYEKAMGGDNFVFEDVADIVSSFGGNVEPYKPQCADFYTKLEETYPITLKFLTGDAIIYGQGSSFVADIADMESRLAAYTTDK